MGVSTTNAMDGPLATDGVATVFPFTFTAPSIAEVEVLSRDDTTKAVTIVDPGDYTVTLTNPSGGDVTFGVAPADGADLFLRLKPNFTQDIVFAAGGQILASFLNSVANQGVARDQALQHDVDRAVIAALGESGLTLRPRSEIEGKSLKVSGDEIIADEAAGAAEGPITIQAERTDTAWTLASTDAYDVVPCNNASPITITVPPSSGVPFDEGAWFEFWQVGAGAFTFAAGAGVTLRASGSRLTSAGQHAVCALRYAGSDVWQVMGERV